MLLWSAVYQRLPESHKKIHENILLPPTKSIVNVWENKLSNNTIQFIEFISRKYLLKSGYTLKNHIDWLNLIYLLIVHSFMYIVFRLKKRLIFNFKKITHAFPYKELVF